MAQPLMSTTATTDMKRNEVDITELLFGITPPGKEVNDITVRKKKQKKVRRRKTTEFSDPHNLPFVPP
jgi:hypothetical protein